MYKICERESVGVKGRDKRSQVRAMERKGRRKKGWHKCFENVNEI